MTCGRAGHSHSHVTQCHVSSELDFSDSEPGSSSNLPITPNVDLTAGCNSYKPTTSLSITQVPHQTLPRLVLPNSSNHIQHSPHTLDLTSNILLHLQNRQNSSAANKQLGKTSTVTLLHTLNMSPPVSLRCSNKYSRTSYTTGISLYSLYGRTHSFIYVDPESGLCAIVLLP